MYCACLSVFECVGLLFAAEAGWRAQCADLVNVLTVALHKPSLYAASRVRSGRGPSIQDHRPRTPDFQISDFVARDDGSKVGRLLRKIYHVHEVRERQRGVSDEESDEADAGVDVESISYRTDGVSLLVTVCVIEAVVTVSGTCCAFTALLW